MLALTDMGSVLGTANPEGKLSRMDIENLPPARASIVVEAVLSEKKEDATTDTKKDGTGTEVHYTKKAKNEKG